MRESIWRIYCCDTMDYLKKGEETEGDIYGYQEDYSRSGHKKRNL